MTISREIDSCKPLILKGLQKKSENISTHLLTLLIMRAILQLEQGKRKNPLLDVTIRCLIYMERRMTYENDAQYFWRRFV